MRGLARKKGVVFLRGVDTPMHTMYSAHNFTDILKLFKDYAKTFTTPILTNFFWWLLLRIRLKLVVSNSSGLQQVPC